MNILVVDDSQMTRLVTKKVLATLGIETVLEATDGQDALSVFESNEVDIIFSDWNMPVMTGLELLKAVRAKNKTLPFIMVTTEGTRSRVVEAIQHGVSDYLVKPFNTAALEEKLRKWVCAPATA